jgi:hypothetical protein
MSLSWQGIVMNKRQAEIMRRAAERGQQGAKKLVDTIISNLDASLSSGLLTETDAPSIEQLKIELKEGILGPLISTCSLFDPQTGTIGATFLWHLIGTVYRAGQVTPNAMIAEDILGPEIARKADSKKGSSGGKVSSEYRKPATDAKHAEVLRLGREIEDRRAKNNQEAISETVPARSIAKKLPEGMKLGVRQISNILKAAKI